jgi:hypothetical protein
MEVLMSWARVSGRRAERLEDVYWFVEVAEYLFYETCGEKRRQGAGKRCAIYVHPRHMQGS